MAFMIQPRRRGRRRKKLERLLLPIALLGLLLPSILYLPLAFFCERWRQKQLKAIVASFPCVTCGRVLGEESIRIAKEEFEAFVADIEREHRGARICRVNALVAKCGHCGARYRQTDARTLVLDCQVRPICLAITV